jgi:hypothetical protein
MSLNPNAPLELPAMKMLEQHWDVPAPIDIQAAIDKTWDEIKSGVEMPQGGQVAVGVGSRGIANLPQIVAGVIQKIKEAGGHPFIVPAMGSHGGATAEGQAEVLAARGVTEDSVGAPIRATMEVEPLGTEDGIPLFIDRNAYEADGIVVINRIKQHTNFYGPTESGIIKMLAIGFGKQYGAEHYHRLTALREYGDIMRTAGKAVLEKSKVLFGVGIVENQDHETCAIRMAPKPGIYNMEVKALELARSLLPVLPLDDIDLLIVDQIGKDISGEGMDPNVVGRDVCACGMPRNSPMVHRIMVRDVTEGSEGSLIGIGNADFTVQRLVDKMDFNATNVNCITSCCPEAGRIPLTYPNDRIALKNALLTLRPYTMQDLRLVHIKNTMELKHMLVSEGCWAEMKESSGVTLEGDVTPWSFDADNEMVSPLMV